MTPLIDVAMSGGITLGPEIVCDGFLHPRKARVQTHVHFDHMTGFEASKGFQDILVSEGTRELLCMDQDADLPYRANIRVLRDRVPYQVGKSRVALVSSDHMLGSVQVEVQVNHGPRIGYSGDFAWPLEHVIEVDALVVDSTYGAPENVREYSQGECETWFLDLVSQLLRRGPVHIFAHRGTLHRALQLITEGLECPLVASAKLCKEAEVYRQFGYAINPITSADSPEGRDILSRGRFVRFYGTGDKRPVSILTGATISLSAYFSRPDTPIMEYSERSFGVALSNHADFYGTLEYVRATGAKFVVTDNTRGGKAYDLAVEIKSRLGINAQPSSDFESEEWGTG